MKVTTLLILISIWFLRIKITEANYRRILRGPPQSPRQPPPYMKKWPMSPHPPPPPRPQLRPRPIPVKVPPSFKKPIRSPVLTTRHITPIRNVWENTQSFKVITEKPFLSSPTISVPEYDYHIQTNSIPTHTNTIKQVGEKGPIHTIPAPNLSLADKPSNIIEQQSVNQIYQSQQPHTQTLIFQPQQLQQLQNSIYQQKQPQHQRTIVEIQKSHQYQVTEEEPGRQQIKLQPLFYEPNPTIGANEVRDINKIASPEQLNNFAHAEFLVAPQPEQSPPMTAQELYKLLNLYPQQQLLDSYGLPVGQQPQLQQHLIRQQQVPSYQAILATAQTLPQLSYENLDQRNVQGKQISSRPADGFNLKPAKDALAQAQYVQHYFDTRDEPPTENIVEPDAQATNNFENEIPKDAFYSTLPNRQAAETLASLQEAGKLNTNFQQGKQVETQNQKVPITIYVPDSYEDNEEVETKDSDVDVSQEHSEYEDDLQSEANEANVRVSSYGNRVRPKTQ